MENCALVPYLLFVLLDSTILDYNYSASCTLNFDVHNYIVVHGTAIGHGRVVTTMTSLWPQLMSNNINGSKQVHFLRWTTDIFHFLNLIIPLPA